MTSDPRRRVRLSQIGEQVRLGRYRVAAEQVADAILAAGGRSARVAPVRSAGR